MASTTSLEVLSTALGYLNSSLKLILRVLSSIVLKADKVDGYLFFLTTFSKSFFFPPIQTHTRIEADISVYIYIHIKPLYWDGIDIPESSSI